jgi:serine/threonine-protein kinase
VEEAVQILRDACQGLDYAHRAGVVHRDVKPGNLLITKEMHTTKIADFGIAKAAELTRITQVGSVLGTAAYLSPEQAHGDEAGPSSDIYSLGVCAYQFLTGRLPHEYGSLTELALKQQQDAVTPITSLRPEVPRELDEAVRLSLEREPEGRYGSALQFAHALDAGLHGETTEVTRHLSLDDADATRSMRQDELDTAATRALRARPIPVPPSRSVPPARATPPPQPREREDPRRADRRRNLTTFLALIGVIAAVAAIGLVLISSSSNNSVQSVDRNDVQSQIQGLRDFLNEHSR